MDTIIIAKESDIKLWIKEAIEESLQNIKIETVQQELAEPLVSREEIAKYLDDISLVTLHSWMNEGLPYHKQGGRVYFLKSEVLEYVKGRRKGDNGGA